MQVSYVRPCTTYYKYLADIDDDDFENFLKEYYPDEEYTIEDAKFETDLIYEYLENLDSRDKTFANELNDQGEEDYSGWGDEGFGDIMCESVFVED